LGPNPLRRPSASWCEAGMTSPEICSGRCAGDHLSTRTKTHRNAQRIFLIVARFDVLNEKSNDGATSAAKQTDSGAMTDAVCDSSGTTSPCACAKQSQLR